MIGSLFKRLKYYTILKRHAIKHHQWEAAIEQIPLLQPFSRLEKARLRELSSLFLHQKAITGIGIELDEQRQIIIAAQACVPVLALGIEVLAGWCEVLVYPDVFLINRDESDDIGVIHHKQAVLSGEAWLSGPLILAWATIEQDFKFGYKGHNVVIHEIAHKLDMLNGRANGMPPLHLDMQISQWTKVMTHAYQALYRHLRHHRRGYINPYAATDPAEFFAVISELFFSAPAVLQQHYPQVYRQLTLYYRQDPLSRLSEQ